MYLKCTRLCAAGHACLIAGLGKIGDKCSCKGGCGHGLEPDLAGARNSCVEESLTAQKSVAYALDGLNVNSAGGFHCSKESCVYQHGLTGSQNIFAGASAYLKEDCSLTAEFLHDEAFAAEEACAYLFLEENIRSNADSVGEVSSLLSYYGVGAVEVKGDYVSGEG